MKTLICGSLLFTTLLVTDIVADWNKATTDWDNATKSVTVNLNKSAKKSHVAEIVYLLAKDQMTVEERTSYLDYASKTDRSVSRTAANRAFINAAIRKGSNYLQLAQSASTMEEKDMWLNKVAEETSKIKSHMYLAETEAANAWLSAEFMWVIIKKYQP